MSLRPRRELVDTESGEAWTDGVVLPFVWLEGHEHGFYLGTDTDSWQRGLYWDPQEEHVGFYCFDPIKLEKALYTGEELPLLQFFEALNAWRKDGSVASVHRVLALWDGHLANRRLLLTEEPGHVGD